jgi:hypothetical protein
MTMEGTSLTRRALFRSTALATGALAFGPGFYRSAFAAAPAKPGPGPYGPLRSYDANGIALPRGFSSRVLARGGRVVSGTSYIWHTFTDGQAAFPTVDGGWILVANSEVPVPMLGGASSITFDRSGRITGARRVLGGTRTNCAGGPTPWGTWLSGEEHPEGLQWECDPTGERPAVARPAMGTFQHESVCVDPAGERLYQTEDVRDGCFYRFTPADYPDLSAGLLEVAKVAPDGKVTWERVPQPNSTSPPTRNQVPGATRFNGGEGTWFDSGVVFFTTKGDRKVWAYDTVAETMEVVYDAATAGEGSALRSVDNVCVHRSGDIFVCEDGDNLEICLITPDRQVAPFLRCDARRHAGIPGLGNETVGVTFDPSGTRLYFGIQRTNGQGILLEVSGPFRGHAGAPAGIVAGSRLAPTGEGPLTARDRVAPGVRLRHARSISAANLARRGLAMTFGLDEPAAIDARLLAPGGRQIARTRTSVAVSGRVRLRVRPGPRTGQALRRRRRPLKARLVVVVRDRAGNRRTIRRRVTVRPPVRGRRRRR